MCALRELFEETNILLAKKGESGKEEEPTLEAYNGKHKADFISFSKACGIRPDIESMSGFCRLGSPITFSPANDTQFYLYFQQQQESQRPIILNEAEFTDYKWLTPDEALNLYSQSQLPLFPPQVFILTLMKSLASTYSSLSTDIAKSLQQSYLTYISNKMLFFNLPALASE